MKVTGAGGVLIREDRVLLILRKNASRFNGLWSNPGGVVEPGETPEEAALRELWEEVGLECSIERLLAHYQDYEKGRGVIGVYAGFLMSFVGEPRIMEPEKIDALGWWPIYCLPENLAPYTSGYISSYKNPGGSLYVPAYIES